MNSKIAILLCTYHGQRYLADQLDSISAQTHTNWEVWASDDGSQDETHAILQFYKAKWGSNRLSIHFGPAEGFAANFLLLTCNTTIQAEFYAYSDQDDIWEADKLQRAVDFLKNIPTQTPALYCSRTSLVDEKNYALGFSPLFSRPPSFANALMQNIAGGNTMVFNKAARKLLQMAGENVNVVAHDWWAYLVVAGCGGQVFYDPIPTVRYRQHDENLIGTGSSWLSRLSRILKLFQGRVREINGRHIEALNGIRSYLTRQNQETLDRFSKARNLRLLPRLLEFKKAGIYRQSFISDLGLIAAALFNKL